MRRDLNSLVGSTHDLLVVGGGIAGCTIAWEAATRGLRVALIERGDFGVGSTSGCYRIIHGGLRHLQSLDFSGMRSSIQERSFFLRALPHLVAPASFLVPTSRGGLTKSRTALSAALRINDWIGRNRNAANPDPTRQIPGSRMLSVDETRRCFPFLPTEGITGAGVFHDAVMYSTDRVVLAFAEAASRAGATLANHVAAQSVNADAVEARDELTGSSLVIRARFIVDASGPWSGWWRVPPAVPKEYSAGFQLVTPPVETGGHIAAFTTAAGKRYFAMPWRGRTVWGTADRLYRGAPDEWRISEQDIEEFLREINLALPGLALGRSSVLESFGGLRPAGSEMSASAASGRAELQMASSSGGPGNLLVVTATKFTTARLLAAKAVDLVGVGLGQVLQQSCTLYFVLNGCVSDWTAYRSQIDYGYSRWPAETREHLCRLYGAVAEGLLAAPDIDLARRELAEKVEMALTPDDLARRLE